MTYDLMPYTVQDAQHLNDDFSKTMFRSTDDFITFYNSGLINKQSLEVASFAERVAQSFKNVKLQNRTLIFISKTEVEVHEALVELRKWEIVVKIKARCQQLLTTGELTKDSVLHFNDRGEADVMTDEVAAGSLNERFYRPADEGLVGLIHTDYSSLSDAEKRRFTVNDFTKLDESFLENVHRAMFANGDERALS